jgi:hypothetical protein
MSDFTDEQIQEMLNKFDSPEKIEQFYYILKLLVDDNVKDDDEIDFDVYILKQKELEEPKEVEEPIENVVEKIELKE